MFSCVTMQLNVVIRDSYKGGGGGGGALGYPPKAQTSPLIFLRIIINFIRCQIQGFKESKFVSKNLTSKIIILQDMPPTSLA